MKSEYEIQQEKEFMNIVKLIGGIVLFIILCVVLGMWLSPKYRVYKQDLQGQANLRQQEWEKKILVEQARAENESANLKAEARVTQAKAEASAEIERAKGSAQANVIIGDSLKGNEDYLRYLWITGLEQGANTERIYIPTEAGMPILEARNR